MPDHQAAASKPRNRISPRLDMRQPKASRLTEPSPKPPIFQVRRPDTLQFGSVEGLSRMAGVSRHWLRRLITKEATDKIARFLPTGRIHLRGSYYRILAAGDVLLPDGSRFVAPTGLPI